MRSDSFDINTRYLKEPPPPFIETGYTDFKKFYETFAKKKIQLNLLIDYCNNLKKNKITPECLIIGGSFLRNEDSKDAIIKIIAVFKTKMKVDHKSNSKYFSRNGDAFQRYKGKIEPIGRMTIADPMDVNSLQGSLIDDLHKDHSLDNSFAKVGLVKLSFDEVVPNEE